MGGRQEKAIEFHPILSWYMEQSERLLCGGGARLVGSWSATGFAMSTSIESSSVRFAAAACACLLSIPQAQTSLGQSTRLEEETGASVLPAAEGSVEGRWRDSRR